MAEYNLFMGGLAGNSNNLMVPQNTPCDISGYADHQRRRSYAVTRQLDFRPRVPFGGLTEPVDQKDYCWYQNLLASGVDIQVGDFLNLIVVTAFSRLEFIEMQVVLPKTDLVMTVVRREFDCPPDSPDENSISVTAASNSELAVNAIGATAGIFWSARIDASLLTPSYVSLEVTAVPASPGSAGVLGGLFLLAQAEVVDWGSYDFNGNA